MGHHLKDLLGNLPHYFTILTLKFGSLNIFKGFFSLSRKSNKDFSLHQKRKKNISVLGVLLKQ